MSDCKALSVLLLSGLCLLFSGCNDSKSDALFQIVESAETGIDFRNNLFFQKEFNIYTYRNFYDGGGVAVGDLSGNGLPDIYFVNNMGDNRLYYNLGDFKFEDVTDQAGVAGGGDWSTGASLVDINGNGLLDIYVSNSGMTVNRRNELFINNGDGIFTESAQEYGIDDNGYSIQATFADYNSDGLLDLYLVNNANEPITNFDISGNFRGERDSLGGDRLYINEGNGFKDVTEAAGIYSSITGFGLSATASDVDRDGNTDLFVANDFFERDFLYKNTGDGTLVERIDDSVIRSMSAASMGADIADLNNDGWPDIYVLDMLPDDDSRKKSVTTFEGFERYQNKIEWSYGHQMTRNVLNLNQGDFSFSEVSRLADVHATDWSWAALISDYDNNGHNDIFVTNGLVHDITDLDYLEDIRSPDRMRSVRNENEDDFQAFIDIIPSNPISNFMFSNEGSLEFSDQTESWGLDAPGFSSGAAWADLDGDGALDLVVNQVNGPARIYRNRAAELLPNRNWLQVSLEGEAPNTQAIGAQLQVWSGGQGYWYREHFLQRGFQSSVQPGLHVGLGDIAVVDSLVLRWPDGRTSRMTNLEVPARITLRQSEASTQPAPPPQPATMPGDFTPKDLQESNGSETWQSPGSDTTKDLTALSGCETCKRLASDPITTPTTTTTDRNPNGAGTLSGRSIQDLQESNGSETWQSPVAADQSRTADSGRSTNEHTLPGPLLEPAALPPLTDWRHERYSYSDFDRERLLLHMRSTEGPALCTGDVNGDGREDVYTGGARGQAGTLWTQTAGGGFTPIMEELFEGDKGSEDMDCAFFDATGNGADDLYVVSGGNSYSTSSSLLADRMYLSDGQGRLSKSNQLLPTARGYDAGSVVAPHDFTGDGVPDLFVGTRLRPFAVGIPVNGYLLAGNGDGTFTDVTDIRAPQLLDAGMITDALWADLTDDGASELVVVGEWMPVRVFANTGESLEEISGQLGLSETHGWWNAVAAGDVNGDGRIDLIGGNHGRNSIFKASAERPVRMWAGDIAGNGITQQILSYPKDGKNYPVALRHDLIAEIPALAGRYPDYASYGGESVEEIFSEGELSGALELRATILESTVFWNEADGFRGEALPVRVQLAPMYGVHTADLTGDGSAEILMGGNLYDVKPQAGPYDASRGMVIDYRNDRLGTWPADVSGINTNGEIRGFQDLRMEDGTQKILIARYDGYLEVFNLLISQD